MTEKKNNGIKVMRLAETHEGERNSPSDAMAMFRIWTLLTGGEALRDQTVGNRVLR